MRRDPVWIRVLRWIYRCTVGTWIFPEGGAGIDFDAEGDAEVPE
jgi:hypothetical protein